MGGCGQQRSIRDREIIFKHYLRGCWDKGVCPEWDRIDMHWQCKPCRLGECSKEAPPADKRGLNLLDPEDKKDILSQDEEGP